VDRRGNEGTIAGLLEPANDHLRSTCVVLAAGEELAQRVGRRYSNDPLLLLAKAVHPNFQLFPLAQFSFSPPIVNPFAAA
jgi:hypothetical protein